MGPPVGPRPALELEPFDSMRPEVGPVPFSQIVLRKGKGFLQRSNTNRAVGLESTEGVADGDGDISSA
jgi:hypothetical protein